MIDDEKLIELVRANDIIYNKFRIGYMLPEKKKEVWRNIANEMGAIEEQCSRRWMNLRERFARESKRMKTSSDSTAESETWPLYHSLSFLKKYIKPRRGALSDEELIESTQPFVEKPTQTIVNVEMDRNNFYKCCVGLLAVEDLPMDIFDDHKSFKVLISPLEKKFGTDINSEQMQQILNFCSKKIKKIISRRLKNKLISLKLDTASQSHTNVVILSAQYMVDFKIYTYTLGIIQLQQVFSTSHMKTEIVHCLNSYNLDLSQIYAVTVGDGMNSIKTLELIHELSGYILELNLATEISSKNDSLQEALSQESAVSILTAVNCATDLIQSFAFDVIAALELNLNDCRNVVHKVHSYIEKYDEQLEAPALDDRNKWLSTCEMLKSLLNIKDFIDSKALVSSEDGFVVKWEFVTNFLTCFKPLEQFFNKLFEEQYVIGDFYRDWLECELELENFGTSNAYASHLRLEMQKHKSMLLQNNAVLATLYLDPRFNLQKSPMLMQEQKSAALTHIVNIYDRMMKLQHHKQRITTSSNPTNYSELDDEIPGTSVQSSNLTQDQRMNTIMKLILLDKKSFKAPINTDALHYWKKSTFDDDIRSLAQIILAVPVTQFFVNSTSSVASTITKYKTRLTGQTLNDLILTKSNFNFINSPTTNLDLALEKIVL